MPEARSAGELATGRWPAPLVAATGWRRAMSRKPSCLTEIQLEPDGGLSAGDGRQGSMKLARSAASRLRIRSINMPLI
jgi:hypothetical protein